MPKTITPEVKENRQPAGSFRYQIRYREVPPATRNGPNGWIAELIDVRHRTNRPAVLITSGAFYSQGAARADLKQTLQLILDTCLPALL